MQNFWQTLLEVIHDGWSQVRGWFAGTGVFKTVLILGGGAVLFGVMVLSLLFLYFSIQLPDFRTLADYKPAQITRVYAHDGQLVTEFARERRIYTPIRDIPKELIQAYLAAEDSSFFEHQGFDPRGILRAAVMNTLTDKKQGASTITQQVAKTFLLSSERTYSRKIKELILAYRIEKAFTKQEILELYLNQIYLGAGAYGVTAAGITYFSKPLKDLTIGQRALLAGLPKAPSAYNPLRNPDNAKARRDLIIRRMQDEGYITAEQADKAIATGLELSPANTMHGTDAPDFAESVRRELVERYGEEEVYENGFVVQTTLDVDMQRYATKAVRYGVRSYDRRHGWRGPLENVSFMLDWQTKAKEMDSKYSHMRAIGTPAVVLGVNNKKGQVQVGFASGDKGIIPMEGLRWARKHVSASGVGPEITKPSDVLKEGDVVLVKRMSDVPELAGVADAKSKFSLEQWPNVQAALIALDPQTGAIRAMVGGFDGAGNYNRAIQAERQPGSSFKPFVYATALEQGYTNSSIILDAPLVLDGGDSGEWRPQNYTNEIYGPSTLRRGLEQSRNLMTIRLARDIGINNVIDRAGAYGLNTKGLSRNDLSTSLGSGSLSLISMTSAYSVFVNAGKRVAPYFMESIQDVTGRQILRGHEGCEDCEGIGANPGRKPRPVALNEQQVIDPVTAYQMVEMLRGVVLRGTGAAAKAVGQPVAGKTGTTNDYVDAWFIGFSANLVTGVWIGFDIPSTLGNAETGGRAALPIWVDFMKNALKDGRNTDFDVPPGVTFVTVDADTGELPSSASTNTLLDVFPQGKEPTTVRSSFGGFFSSDPSDPGNTNTGNQPPVEIQGIY